MNEKTRKQLLVFGSIIHLIAIIILVTQDWKMALGIFLFGWAQNINWSIKK